MSQPDLQTLPAGMSQPDLQTLPAGCSFPRGTRLVFLVYRTCNGRKVKGHKIARLALEKRTTSAEVVAMRDALHRAAVIHTAGASADPLGFVSKYSYADFDEDVAALDQPRTSELAA